MGEFARRVVVAVLITLMLLAVAYLMWRGAHVLLQAFAGVLFAVFLSTLSEWVSKRTGLSYGWSLAVVVVGLFLIGGGLAHLLWSRLAIQFGELMQTLPRSLDQIKSYLMQYTWGKYLIQNAPGATTQLVHEGRFTELTGFVSGIFGFLEATVVILIVGIFGAAEPDLYKAGLFHLLPPRSRPRVGQAIDAIAFNLRHWLVAQLLLMVMIGITTGIGLWLIGVPLALILGLIAGLFELVPYIGAWLSAVPAGADRAAQGPPVSPVHPGSVPLPAHPRGLRPTPLDPAAGGPPAAGADPGGPGAHGRVVRGPRPVRGRAAHRGGDGAPENALRRGHAGR